MYGNSFCSTRSRKPLYVVLRWHWFPLCSFFVCWMNFVWTILGSFSRVWCNSDETEWSSLWRIDPVKNTHIYVYNQEIKNWMNHRQTGKRTHTIECTERRCCATPNTIHRERKNDFSGCNETQESHWCPFEVTESRTTTTTTTAMPLTATMTHSRRVEHDSLPFRRRRNIFYILFAIVITVLSWCDPVSAVTKHANYIAQKSGE